MPSLMIKKFEGITKPLDDQIRILHSQNKLHKEARDILQHKLTTGEIEV